MTSGPEKLIFSKIKRDMINLSCGMGGEAELAYDADAQEALEMFKIKTRGCLGYFIV